MTARRIVRACLVFTFLPIVVAAQAALDPFGPRERQTVGAGPLATIDTPHLTVVTGASDAKVSPGSRLSLTFDVTPRRGIHVYAPGKHTYQVVRVTLDAQPWLRVPETTYPKSEIYYFEPLDERVEVYQKPFRLLQDVTLLATPEAQKLLAGQTSVTLTGKLEYQACDDKVCYAPRSVPVKWTFPLQPPDRKPAG